MASRGTVAAEEYTDTDGVGARSGWFTQSVRPTVAVTALQGELNNSWFDLGTSTAGYIERRYIPDAINPVREVEFTAALYFPSGISPGNFQVPMRIGTSTSTSLAGVQIQARANPNSGLNNSIYISRRDATVDTGFDTGLVFSAGQVLYCTIRMRAESSSTAADGQAEVWINGNNVYTESGINWSNAAANSEFTGLMYSRVSGISAFATHVRSIMCNDSFTTAFGTAPEWKHVVGSVNVTVVATDELEAISDNVDGTSIDTAIASAQASVDFTVPASLASRPVRDVQVRTKVSRTNTAFNDIDVEVRDGAGTNVLATSTYSVAAIAPAREDFESVIIPSSSINLDDYTVVVRNGA